MVNVPTMLKVQSGLPFVWSERDRTVTVSPTFHLNSCSSSGVASIPVRVLRMASRSFLSTFACPRSMRKNKSGSVAIAAR